MKKIINFTHYKKPYRAILWGNTTICLSIGRGHANPNGELGIMACYLIEKSSGDLPKTVIAKARKLLAA
jgi:hypothetical protein